MCAEFRVLLYCSAAWASGSMRVCIFGGGLSESLATRYFTGEPHTALHDRSAFNSFGMF